MGCKHNYQYSQGQLRCSKCNKIGKEQTYRKNHNKKYASIAIVVIVFLVVVIINANYNITLESEKIDNIVPVESIENTFEQISNSIPINKIENTLDDISDKIPVKIEEKLTTKNENTMKNYSEAELQAMAIDWDYDDILRNVENYRGKLIHLEGPIDRTERISDSKFGFLVLTNPHKFPTPDKHNYVMVNHVGSGFVNDDVVELWGTVEVVENLPTLFGAEQIMPVIKSIKIQCIQCR